MEILKRVFVPINSFERRQNLEKTILLSDSEALGQWASAHGVGVLRLSAAEICSEATWQAACARINAAGVANVICGIHFDRPIERQEFPEMAEFARAMYALLSFAIKRGTQTSVMGIRRPASLSASLLEGIGLSARHETARLRYSSLIFDGELNAALVPVLATCLSTDGFRYRWDGLKLQRETVKALETPDSAMVSAKPVSFRQGGCYVLTGGAGGVGSLVSRWLKERYQAQICVLGRSELGPQLRGRLKDNGVKLYLRSDVSDPESLSEALSVIKRRYSEIDGVFHLAGVIDDHLIVNRDRDKIAGVLAPKVAGGLNLWRLASVYRPKLICNFSSLSGLLGNIGQADYSAANAFLDSLAEYAAAGSSQETYWCSVNWGLWASEGMQVPAGRKDLVPLEPNAACGALALLLSKSMSSGVVYEGSKSALGHLVAASGSDAARARPETPAAAITETQLEMLRAFLRDLIYKFSRLEDVPGTQSLIELGLESVAIINIVTAIEHRLARTSNEIMLSKALIFDYPTVDALTEFLARKYPPAIALAFGEGNPIAPPPSKPQVQRDPDAQSTSPTSAGKPTARPVDRDDSSSGAGADSTNYRLDDLAIVGLAGEFPAADSIKDLWKLLERGESAIKVIPSERWDWRRDYSPDQDRKNGSYGRHGGFINRAKQFDPAFFGILPVDAVKIDPQERRLLTMTYHALEDAGYFAAPSTDMGVFGAVMYAHYQNLQGRSNTINSSFASVVNRISYTFNFHGPSLSVDTMCSGSLSALHFAMNSIRSGECRQAIVGAANVMSHPGKYRVLSEGRFLSPTGRCHSFGIEADGYVPGEGAIAIVIKPLRDALESQDRIHGIIRGSALNSSGRSSSFTVPSSRAQEEVIRGALRAADVRFEDVDYIEAHGTGTSLGDPIEIQALAAACGNSRQSTCFVGSIKSNIGHLESAAGLAGLTKILLQFQKRKIAPTINCAIENPHLNLSATMFRLPRKVSAWPAKQGGRFAALSSFGAGGSNGHAILQEYTNQHPKNLPHRQQYLVPISGKTQGALNRRVSELAEWLDGNADTPAYSIGYTLSIGREHFRCRSCFVVKTAAELRDQLASFSKTGVTPVPDQLDPQVSGIRAAYLANGNAPFQELYPVRDVISLPGYPFEQQEYWDSEIAQGWGGTDSPALSRHSTAFLAFQPGWEAVPLSSSSSGTSSRCIVVCNPEQVSELESCAGTMILTCGERHLIREKSVVVRMDSLEDCVAALQHFLGFDRSVKADIVNLLRGPWVQHRGSPAQLQFQFNLARALLQHGGQFRVISVYESGGSDPESPTGGAIAQLFRVVAMEEKCIQFLSMEADEVLFRDARKTLEHAKAELDGRRHEFRACRRTWDLRFVYKLHEVAVQDLPAGRFRQQGVYLITGGLGMIGSAVAQKLLTDLNANVVLIGRSPKNNAIEEKIRRLQALGGNLAYVSVDINDAGSVDRVVQSIRTRYGNLNGVIHCAGILKDTLFRNKSWPEFEEVVGVKLRGAQNLDRATEDFDLDFFVLFSSMSSIFGNVGQSDYVVGNSFLDFFAEARMRRAKLGMCHGLSLSINWPLWFDDPSGKDDSMAAYRSLGHYLFDTYGLGSLTIEEGVAIFMRLVDSLDLSVSQITPLIGDFNKIRRSVVSGILGPAGERRADALQNDVAGTGDPGLLTAALCSIASELSGLPQDGISWNAGFGDLGFSSVMLQQLAVQIEREFGVSMPPSAFFSYHSIEKLSAYLAGRGVRMRDQASPHVSGDAAKLEPVRPAQISSSNSLFCNRSAAEPGPKDEHRIAIIGIDGRLPGGYDLQEFWKGLVNNASAIQEMKRWPDKACFGGVIPDIEFFDAKFFGMSAREAMLMDPQHRLFLQASYNAMMDAGYAPRELSRTGVFAGVQFSDYQSLLHTSRQGSHPYAATGNAHAMLANRVSYTFDFHGPSETIDTACSSALVAIHRAVSSLSRRECDFAIAGAVSLLLDSTITDAAESMGILSPNHRCATFDAEADGYVRSEGVGCVILKRLADAVADGDSIYAIIESVAENHGGRASSLTAPNPEAQKRLLMAAYTPELARRVTYIETHGTGTKLGDPVEIDGLKGAWKALVGESGRKTVYLGAVKTNIGHLEPAAGIAGLLKVILCLKHQTLPANINFNRMNPYIVLDGSPFALLTKNVPWHDDGLRVAGISSFGFGGSNVHLVLSEVPSPARSRPHDSLPRLVMLSAKSADSLVRMKDSLLGRLISPDGSNLSLSDVTATLAQGRDHFDYRLAWVVSSVNELVEALRRTGQSHIRHVTKEITECDNPRFVSNGNGQGDLSKLCESYLCGAQPDWSTMSRVREGRRVHLPGYVFDSRAFWFENRHEPEAIKDSAQGDGSSSMKATNGMVAG